ncbi:uncharacterized protein OCT59_021253 [Rhizophagus irregularis]|uniref:uncharacterized protein n=1 Tax=Rhizophagus irregularis TaxID=588596 RepID=UPI0033310F21|nr:hypothetical protein OCT59_021253 [Rhizophagus irregularis]
MERTTNYKCKIDFKLSNNTSSIQPTQDIIKSKYKKSKCNECNKRRKPLDKSHQICHVCYKVMSYEMKKSRNKVIDDFIRNTQISLVKGAGKMEFVSYDQFKDIEFLAEGGFSKVYKATWINGPLLSWNIKSSAREGNYTVVLKKLNNSNYITSKELNELKVFYNYSAKFKRKWYKYDGGNYVCKYFGITQDPNSQDIMIIMPYYDSECWHSDPKRRPLATDIFDRVNEIIEEELENYNNNDSTEIIKSSDIGPVPKNNPNAIYKSRNLSDMIQSAMSLRISRSQSINLEQFNYYQKNNMGPTGKRKYENDLIDNGHFIKRKKLVENENNDYLSKEFEFDIDVKINNNEYITIENDFDINL